MNADGFAFDEDGFEGLDGETMERRRAVEQHRVALCDFFQDVPDFGRLAFDHFLGGAHGVHVAEFLEAANDERLEKDERHFLRETALVQFEFRTDDDDGTAGVIDAFAEEVLAETAALALEHVAEGFERAIAGAGDGATMTAIVEEGVHGFLQHALFVADDDFRRFELEQVFETVIAVDDATIEIVEIGRRETAAFERNERAEVRRNDRQDREDHPFRTAFRGDKTLIKLDALGDFFADLLGLGFGHRDLQGVDL